MIRGPTSILKRPHRTLLRQFAIELAAVVGIAILAALAIPVLVLGAFWTYSKSLPEPVPFSPASWRSVTRYTWGGDYLRLHMAQDLVARDGLRGRTRSETLDMLGPSAQHGYFAKSSRPYVDSYHLGTGLMPDHWWLVVEFDRDDVVVKASVQDD